MSSWVSFSACVFRLLIKSCLKFSFRFGYRSCNLNLIREQVELWVSVNNLGLATNGPDLLSFLCFIMAGKTYDVDVPFIAWALFKFLLTIEICILENRYAEAPQGARIDWDQFTRDYFLNRETLVSVFLLIDASIPVKKIDLEYASWLGQNQVIVLFLIFQ